MKNLVNIHFSKPQKSLRAFLKDETASAATEYALLLTLSATVAYPVATEVRDMVNELLNDMSRELRKIAR